MSEEKAHAGKRGFRGADWRGRGILAYVAPVVLLLLAGARLVVGDVPLAARILGAVFETLLVLALVHYGRRSSFGPTTGLLTALLLVTNPVFLLTSFSGMELPLFLLLLVLVAHFLLAGRPSAAAVSAAAALWVRFDGIIVLAATLALVFWNRRRELATRPRRVLLALARPICAAMSPWRGSGPGWQAGQRCSAARRVTAFPRGRWRWFGRLRPSSRYSSTPWVCRGHSRTNANASTRPRRFGRVGIWDPVP